VLSLVNSRYHSLMWACDAIVEAVHAANTPDMYLAVIESNLSKPLLVPFAWGKTRRALESTTTFSQVIKVTIASLRPEAMTRFVCRLSLPCMRVCECHVCTSCASWLARRRTCNGRRFW
jgi:hypothetical protein